MKYCKHCNQQFPIDSFAFINRIKQTRHRLCHLCRSIEAKKSYNKHKSTTIDAVNKRTANYLAWFKEYKKSLVCILCSESDSCCLDFHHLDPTTKDFEISTIRKHGINTVKKEISKCVPLCSNCHRKVHANLISLLPQ